MADEPFEEDPYAVIQREITRLGDYELVATPFFSPRHVSQRWVVYIRLQLPPNTFSVYEAFGSTIAIALRALVVEIARRRPTSE